MNYLWTASRARLQMYDTSDGKNLHWLFLPGGPGLGSESLQPLMSVLKLPGTTWLLDLPGDGLNREGSIENWSQALIEAVSALKNVILVAHSRGGMFALATPELENRLKGLVLLDTAPDMNWKEEFSLKIKENPNSKVSLKESVLAGAQYMFTKEGLKKGLESLQNLPYNSEAIQWTLENFDPSYKARWVPKKIPTLILAGSEDLATPLKFFKQKREFLRSNIVMKEIQDAGHFPWIEKPQEVREAIASLIASL